MAFVIIMLIVVLLIFKDVDRFKLDLEVVTWMSAEGRNYRTDRMRKRTSQKNPWEESQEKEKMVG